VALVRHRRGRAFARHEAGARDVLVPRVVAADDLDVRVRLAVRQRAFDLRAAAEELISVADPVSGYAELALTLVVPERRDLARLTVHLDRALAAILERDDQLVLLDAAQHAHVPRPVDQNRLQVSRVGLRRVGRCGAPAELRARRERYAESKRHRAGDRRLRNDPPIQGHDHFPLRLLLSMSYSTSNSIVRRSGSVIERMNPRGLPLRAGRYEIVTTSPATMLLGPSRPNPKLESALAEPVVSTHSVIVPSSFGTSSVTAPCGFMNSTFLTTPVTSPDLRMS